MTNYRPTWQYLTPAAHHNGSINNWGPSFLPAAFQGTDFNASKPLRNLTRPAGVSAKSDLATRSFFFERAALGKIPWRYRAGGPHLQLSTCRARCNSACPRSPTFPPKASTLKMYGADDATNPIKAGFAKNCILARRLLEKGVRFNSAFNGAYQTGGEGVSNWDGHRYSAAIRQHGPVLDQPAAAVARPQTTWIT